MTRLPAADNYGATSDVTFEGYELNRAMSEPIFTIAIVDGESVSTGHVVAHLHQHTVHDETE
jgi:hypothetical protein